MSKVELNKGKNGLKCRFFGHVWKDCKEYFRKKTSKGQEIYKAEVCERCNKIVGESIKS